MTYQPLPVKGYSEQSEANVDVVNVNKVLEETVLRRLDELTNREAADQRWIAIARTHIEQGFMAANRAIFKPRRLEGPL